MITWHRQFPDVAGVNDKFLKIDTKFAVNNIFQYARIC